MPELATLLPYKNKEQPGSTYIFLQYFYIYHNKKYPNIITLYTYIRITLNSSVAPFDVFKCKDDYIALIGYQQHHWKLCNKLLGIEHLTSDPKYKDNKARISNVNSLKVEWESALAKRTAAEWIEIFEQNDIACGPIKSIDQVLQSKQFRHRKMLTTVPDEDGFDSLGFGMPIKISGYKDSQRRNGVSALDADRNKVIRSFL